MEINIYIFIGLITLLNINVNARNIMKSDNYFHRENDMHDEYLAVKESLKISQAELSDANACKCVNGYCEKDTKGKIVCKCPPEWGVASSETECKKCGCGEGANCTFESRWLIGDVKTCICKIGYSAQKTGMCKADCSGKPCKNGGKCKIVGANIACDCVDPYFGDFCEKTCNCGEGTVSCKLDNGKEICECKEGFVSTGDTCAACDCGEGSASCKLDNGKKICECKEGFVSTGDTCAGCDCGEGSESCKLDNGKKICECKDGFVSTGDSCAACDCGEGSASCKLDNAKKICECKEGFFSTGDTCAACDCGKGAVSCNLVNGVKSCECKEGFISTGDTCAEDRTSSPITTPITFRTENSSDMLFTSSQRPQNLSTVFTPEVSIWDKLSRSVIFTTPRNSSNVPETSTSVITSSKKILTSTRRSTREEKTYFTNWDNKTSTTAYTVTDSCSLHNCMNGGICRMVNNRPRCFCLVPFTGEFCEKDPCAPSPCVNGGTCTIQNTKFHCSCNEPFTGNFCEKDPCTANPCQNGGTCFISGYTYKCICKEAFNGDRCESSAANIRYILILVILSLLIATFIVHISCFLLKRCMSKS